MENALVTYSPEDQKLIDELRQENKQMTQISFDTIKLKDSEKEVMGSDGNPLVRGNYYIESYDAAKREKTYRDIGSNPEVVILHRCYTYSWYKEGAGLMAWTSDIQELSEFGFVTLFSKRSGEMKVEFQGRYKPDFKNYIDTTYVSKDIDGNVKKLMDFQCLLYVHFEGAVYRMFVSRASMAGIAPGENTGDFKNPQPGSLKLFENSTRSQEMGGLPEWKCRLGSIFMKDMERPFYLRTFENIGPNDKLPTMLADIRTVRSHSMESDTKLRKQLPAPETKKPEEALPDFEVIDYQPSINPTDLPF